MWEVGRKSSAQWMAATHNSVQWGMGLNTSVNRKVECLPCTDVFYVLLSSSSSGAKTSASALSSGTQRELHGIGYGWGA